jgi:hypothetical protein
MVIPSERSESRDLQAGSVAQRFFTRGGLHLP